MYQSKYKREAEVTALPTGNSEQGGVLNSDAEFSPSPYTSRNTFNILNYCYRGSAKLIFGTLFALILLAIGPSNYADAYTEGTGDIGRHSLEGGGASVAHNTHDISKGREIVFSIAQLGQPLAVITGGCVNVQTLLGSGTDPHLYRLSRADVLKMHRANSIMNLGLHLEVQMQSILDDMSMFKEVYSVGDMISPAGLIQASPGIYDPHLWMDPILWSNVLVAASYQIAYQYPECETAIMAGLDDYLEEIHTVHQEAEDVFATIPEEKKVLVTSHDAFSYFGEQYDIKVLAIQGISTDRQISIRRISKLVEYLVDNDISVVFVESSVNPRDMNAVIEGAASRGYKVTIGGSLYSDAMGEQGTEEGTYIGMFRHNIKTILEAWGVKDSAFSIPRATASFL